jgi:hypothetical protein
MRRTFLLTPIFAGFLCVCASARETAPFGAAQGADGKKPQADSRSEIIEELRADYNDVVDEFAKKNFDAQMRAKQQRIIDNLKRLVEDDDPPPNPNGNSAPENAPKSPPPPSGSKANPPPVKPNPEKAPLPAPKNANGAPGEPKPPMAGQNGDRESPPRNIDELRKEMNKGGGHMDLPPRQREAMDAHARDRFLPRYEELLRAYYRTLAESSRRGANE